MEIRLVEVKEQENRKVFIYKSGRYTVRKLEYENGYRSVDVSIERGDFVPEIYCESDIDCNIKGFEIQTTSYGSLSPEETMKMVAGLQEAIEVAKALNEMFVK